MATALHQYVIYEKPKDYPNKYVVRLWIIGPGTVQAGPLVSTCDTIEQARKTIPKGLVQIPAFENDDPVISEVWM
jgi:hypothetical protein